MLTYPFLDSPLLYIHSAYVPVKSLKSCPTLQPHARVACQAPLSMGFSKQDYWSGLPYPSPGDLSDPGIESVSPWGSCTEGRFFTVEPPEKLHIHSTYYLKH